MDVCEPVEGVSKHEFLLKLKAYIEEQTKECGMKLIVAERACGSFVIFKIPRGSTARVQRSSDKKYLRWRGASGAPRAAAEA